MAPQLTLQVRRFIVRKKAEHYGAKRIRSLVAREFHITPPALKTIQEVLKKFRDTGSIENRPKHREFKFGNQDHRDYVDQCIRERSDISLKELKIKVQDHFQINISRTRLSVMRKSLGWISTGRKYCQMIRQVNKQKRLDWCRQMIETAEEFNDVVFTDETKLQTHEVRRRRNFYKEGERVPLTAKPKHPYSCFVWGGISKRGRTMVIIFEKVMDSEFYQQEILAKVAPWLQLRYPEGHKFMQDNDPKHTSRSTVQYMTDHEINWWPTPPESPDLNPIEMLWNEMKNYCELAQTRDELHQKILAFWRTVTPSKCRKYIGHLPKVLPVVVEKEGNASGH